MGDPNRSNEAYVFDEGEARASNGKVPYAWCDRESSCGRCTKEHCNYSHHPCTLLTALQWLQKRRRLFKRDAETESKYVENMTANDLRGRLWGAPQYVRWLLNHRGDCNLAKRIRLSPDHPNRAVAEVVRQHLRQQEERNCRSVQPPRHGGAAVGSGPTTQDVVRRNAALQQEGLERKRLADACKALVERVVKMLREHNQSSNTATTRDRRKGGVPMEWRKRKHKKRGGLVTQYTAPYLAEVLELAAKQSGRKGAIIGKCRAIHVGLSVVCRVVEAEVRPDLPQPPGKPSDAADAGKWLAGFVREQCDSALQSLVTRLRLHEKVLQRPGFVERAENLACVVKQQDQHLLLRKRLHVDDLVAALENAARVAARGGVDPEFERGLRNFCRVVDLELKFVVRLSKIAADQSPKKDKVLKGIRGALATAYADQAGCIARATKWVEGILGTVSYTHLTLPTIYSV